MKALVLILFLELTVKRYVRFLKDRKREYPAQQRQRWMVLLNNKPYFGKRYRKPNAWERSVGQG